MQRLALALAAVVAFASAAAAQTLPPFMDREFAYPQLLTSEFDGDYRVFAYDAEREAKGREAGKSKGQHIGPQFGALGVRRSQHDLVVQTEVGDVRHVAVGQLQGAGLIVVFVHGRGGSRRAGVDDFAAGGNFNRIKNLVVEANGLYLSPDFSEFSERGAAEVAALVDHYAALSPKARVFVACGSLGGVICYTLAEDAEISARLGGILFLGTYPDEEFLLSEAFRQEVPILIAQGTGDKIYPVEWMEAFFNSIRLASPGYPVKMICFDNGTHGSPIRMVDWRETINWMLSVR